MKKENNMKWNPKLVCNIKNVKGRVVPYLKIKPLNR